MICSGATGGGVRSMRPKPESRAIGVKLSLPCAPAAASEPAASPIAKTHCIRTLDILLVPQGMLPPRFPDRLPPTTLDAWTGQPDHHQNKRIRHRRRACCSALSGALMIDLEHRRFSLPC